MLYVSRARQTEVLRKNQLVGDPDLVIGIGSKWTRRRDETINQKLYERFAVPEYWIVDTVNVALKVFSLADARYVLTAELRQDRGRSSKISASSPGSPTRRRGDPTRGRGNRRAAP